MVNEWQVLVRGSEPPEWRPVPDGRTAARLLDEAPSMFVRARVREPGPWREFPADPPTVTARGGWCHTKHKCHHWFEGECSQACDRGEHDHPHGAPGCSDRSSADSGTGGDS